MSYVPLDTACSILSNGLGLQVSEQFIDGLIDDEKISLYVRVWDGLARPSEPLVSFGVPSKEERMQYINQLDDLMEAPPTVFECCKYRSIAQSVDYYTRNELFTCYEIEGLTYYLRDYEQAHWVFSKEELLAYIEKEKIVNTQIDFDADLKSSPKEPDWVALCSGTVATHLVEIWEFRWKNVKKDVPNVKLLLKALKENPTAKEFKNYELGEHDSLIHKIDNKSGWVTSKLKQSWSLVIEKYNNQK